MYCMYRGQQLLIIKRDINMYQINGMGDMFNRFNRNILWF